MINIFFISSENNNSFGVNQVLFNLKKFLKKKCHIHKSNNFYKFLNTRHNLIHIHGCWKLRIFFYFILSKARKLKVIISPHGMLDPYSLNQKKIIKLIFWHIFQKYIFKFSDQIIVNSINEKKNVQKIITHKNIIIIPHGIKINKLKFNKVKNYKKSLNFIFFSRIDHVKNLDKLIDIWTNNNFFKKINLSIYGDISNHKYFSLIKNKMSGFKNIKYFFPLNKNKIRVLAKHDIFIFPSKSENFGLVILEAMSAGLYLILNKQLPWKHIAHSEFASLINFNNISLINEIKKITKKKNKLRSLNHYKKTQVYLARHYNWENISDLYIFNYKKMVKKI